MVSFTHNHVKMRLASLLRIANALLKNLLCFFDVLTVQVNRVASNFSDSVVLSKYVF